MRSQRIHHVACRRHHAKPTVEWYGQHLGVNFILTIAEDQVPGTHAARMHERELVH